jgi:hypothetical protein
MSPLYTCNDQLCQDDLGLYSLGEVIDHLRAKHKLSFIQRPQGLGVSDSHGNMWYCFHCWDKTGKDHKSFRSDQAMWDHLNAKHDYQLDGIKPEQ